MKTETIITKGSYGKALDEVACSLLNLMLVSARKGEKKSYELTEFKVTSQGLNHEVTVKAAFNVREEKE